MYNLSNNDGRSKVRRRLLSTSASAFHSSPTFRFPAAAFVASPFRLILSSLACFLNTSGSMNLPLALAAEAEEGSSSSSVALVMDADAEAEAEEATD